MLPGYVSQTDPPVDVDLVFDECVDQALTVSDPTARQVKCHLRAAQGEAAGSSQHQPHLGLNLSSSCQARKLEITRSQSFVRREVSKMTK